MPYYGYAGSQHAIEQYYKDLEEKIQSWFGRVRDMAGGEGISGIKTKALRDVKSVTGSIIDYAANNNVDLIVIGTREEHG